MKDIEMTRQEQFAKAKDRLDLALKTAQTIALEAQQASRDICGEAGNCEPSAAPALLDARDDLSEVAAHIFAAVSSLEMARAKAGRINTGGMTRSGGT